MSNVSSQIMHPPIPAAALRRAFYEGAFNLAAAVTEAFRAFRERTGDPTRLYRLSDHVLEDIGLSRAEIGQGPGESFWRA